MSPCRIAALREVEHHRRPLSRLLAPMLDRVSTDNDAFEAIDLRGPMSNRAACTG